MTRRTLYRGVIIAAVALVSLCCLLLVTMLALASLVYGDPIRLYFNQFGERWLELVVLAVVVGMVPFVLAVVDEWVG